MILFNRRLPGMAYNMWSGITINMPLLKVRFHHSNSSISHLENLIFELPIVFNAYREEYNNLSDMEISQMKCELQSGIYVLSPLRLVSVHKDIAHEKFLQIFVVTEFPTVALGFIPSSKDSLLFLTLSRVLNRSLLSSGSFLRNSFGFTKENEMEDFIQEIRQMGSVKMLLYLDFLPSLNTISRTRLMDKLSRLFPNPLFHNLIMSFLNVTILFWMKTKRICL